jgi:hypothetical protein
VRVRPGDHRYVFRDLTVRGLAGSRWSHAHSGLVGIIPERDALLRLIWAVLAEQHDEWAEGRRYLGLNVANRRRPTRIKNDIRGDPKICSTQRISCNQNIKK